jgi:hypothetical protein
LAGGALLTAAPAGEAAGEAQTASTSVKTVLVMFKCHFDLGFIDTQAAVIRRYFEQYYPNAIQIAQSLSESGKDRYIWTTGSWLLYEYLEQANSEQRRRMEQAIAQGHIAWHALPYSWQTEFLSRSAIRGLIGLSKALDRRFGRVTTGAKMTDVPGHSRGLIGPLAESGVTFLHIGVNPASTVPEVPPLFVWKDSDGNSLVVMYHSQYGGVTQVPGSELAVAIEVRNDNSGPHTIEEIHQIYAGLRQQFPAAEVRAANLTEIASAVHRFRGHFPVVTQEIGDTWIYGVPSDPVKVARYREMLRLRERWIAGGRLRIGDHTDLALLRKLGLAAEHTWGTDTKTWLDFDHYTPSELAQMLDRPNYKTVALSWAEKRRNIEDAVASLPVGLREEAVQRLAGLTPVRPKLSGFKDHQPEEPIETAHLRLALDPDTGAVRTLRDQASGREWASADHLLGLFCYQMLSKEDYDQFIAKYIRLKEDWAMKDFGKPNIERHGAQSRTWTAKLRDCQVREDSGGFEVVSRLHIPDEAAEASGVVAWPEEIYWEILVPKEGRVVHLALSWFGKKANRLPEALWLSFRPVAPEAERWMMEKVERPVSPLDVVRGGNRHMHCLSGAMRYRDARGSLTIETIDAPVVALDKRSPIYFSNEQPDTSQGFHFSLFNNAWGTNYIQWFGEDVRFRFHLWVGAA